MLYKLVAIGIETENHNLFSVFPIFRFHPLIFCMRSKEKKHSRVLLALQVTEVERRFCALLSSDSTSLYNQKWKKWFKTKLIKIFTVNPLRTIRNVGQFFCFNDILWKRGLQMSKKLNSKTIAGIVYEL